MIMGHRGTAKSTAVRALASMFPLVKVVAGKPVIVRDGQALDPVSGAALTLPADALQAAEDAMVNNRMRGELDNALAALKLLSPDATVRREAASIGGQTCVNFAPSLHRFTPVCSV